MKTMKSSGIMAILAIAVVAIFSSCTDKDLLNRDFENAYDQKKPKNGEVVLKLSGRQPGEEVIFTKYFYPEKGDDVTKSGEITVIDSRYAFSIDLLPQEEGNIARGQWTISFNSEPLLSPSDGEKNGFSYNLQGAEGSLNISVSGTHGGESFNLTNIIVQATPGTTNPTDPNPTNPTDPNQSKMAPVRIKSWSIASGQVSLDIGLSLQYQANLLKEGTNWTHLKRVQNEHVGGLAASKVGDSVFFTLQFGSINNNWIEFNICSQNQGNQWADPSVWIENYSVFYSTQYTKNGNLPYTNSSSYFGFYYRENYNGHPAIVDYNGNLIYSLGGETNPPIATVPGESGDGHPNYQVRKMANTYWIKTSGSNTTVMWRLNNGEYDILTTVQDTQYPEYRKVTFPAGSSGTLWFRWGTGSISNFSPRTSEMQQSLYWDSQTESGYCVDQITHLGG